MIESAIQTPAPAPEATAKAAQGRKPVQPGDGSVAQLFFELLTSSLEGGLAGGGVSPEVGLLPPAETGVELKPPRANDCPEATRPHRNENVHREIETDRRPEAQRQLDETRQRPESRATEQEANRTTDRPAEQRKTDGAKPVDSKVTARSGPVPGRIATAAGKPDQRQPAGSTAAAEKLAASAATKGRNSNREPYKGCESVAEKSVASAATKERNSSRGPYKGCESVAEKSAASVATKGLRVLSQSGGENAKSETTQLPALQAGALAAEPRPKQDAARMPGELELIQKLLNRTQAKVAPDAVRPVIRPQGKDSRRSPS